MDCGGCALAGSIDHINSIVLFWFVDEAETSLAFMCGYVFANLLLFLGSQPCS